MANIADITNPTAVSVADLQTPDYAKVPLIGSNIYDLDYFSGTQAAIYIGDCYVDEINSFAFSVQQSKTPIYGYASQLFDTTAPGQVIVQGQFSINFKESGYLWLVLQRYKQFETAVDDVLAKNTQFAGGTSNVAALEQKKNGGKAVLGGTNNPFARIKSKGQNLDFISRAGIERLVQGTATRDERFQFYQSLAGYATTSNPNAQDATFENIVEVFEDQVWQPDVSDIDAMARRVDDNFFDDFDIFMVYGDYTKPGANHTVRRIRGIRMLSTSQQISVSGEPITETYTFLARNII